MRWQMVIDWDAAKGGKTMKTLNPLTWVVGMFRAYADYIHRSEEQVRRLGSANPYYNGEDLTEGGDYVVLSRH